MWGRPQKAAVRPSARVRSIDVVHAYGAVLEDEPFGAGGTISDSTLPFDKALIKAALVDVATTDGVPAEQIAMLEHGFLQLASFRQNGGVKSLIWGSSQEPPRTREDLAEVLQSWSDNDEHGLFAAVEKDMKLLGEEWSLRVKISEATRDAQA